MLACFFYLIRFDPDVAELDALARARNVAGIMAHAGPGVKESDLAFLRQQGAFGTGSHGWTVHPLNDTAGGKSYVVFGTPLTTQDFGEFVFEFDGEKLTKLIDERDNRGWRVVHNDFNMTFQPAEKRANIQVKVTLAREA